MAWSTETRCPHCRKDTESGTHNGCYECGRVKHTSNGRIPPKPKD
jgi:hypothetical protein